MSGKVRSHTLTTIIGGVVKSVKKIRGGGAQTVGGSATTTGAQAGINLSNATNSTMTGSVVKEEKKKGK